MAPRHAAFHDLGGPLGLYWAVRQPERVRALALLNTLIYPEMSWAVKAFVLAMKLPGVRTVGTSPWFLEKTMRLGVAQPKGLTPEIIARVQEPFRDAAARQVLAKAGAALSPEGFADLAAGLKELECPVRVIYGQRDRVLPDVAKTMARVQHDLPQTQLTALSDCGHFLQEDRPDEVGRLLAEFLDGVPA